MSDPNSDRKLVTRKLVSIKASTISGFADEVDFTGLNIVKYKKTRVSHIVPASKFMNLCFFFIRALSSDESKIASWTRKWKCKWFVKIHDIKYGPFVTRSEAIDYEKNKLRGKINELGN